MISAPKRGTGGGKEALARRGRQAISKGASGGPLVKQVKAPRSRPDADD
jgi:hypothetical protein